MPARRQRVQHERLLRRRSALAARLLALAAVRAARRPGSGARCRAWRTTGRPAAGQLAERDQRVRGEERGQRRACWRRWPTTDRSCRRRADGARARTRARPACSANDASLERERHAQPLERRERDQARRQLLGAAVRVARERRARAPQLDQRAGRQRHLEPAHVVAHAGERRQRLARACCSVTARSHSPSASTLGESTRRVIAKRVVLAACLAR